MARTQSPPLAAPTPEQPRSLERDLGWLLGRLAHEYTARAQQAVSDLPGGLRSYLILTAVDGRCPETQLELGRQLDIDRSVMTNVLDTMEAAKLIERRPDPADRRARRVTITPTGQRALRRAVKRIAAGEEEMLAPVAGPDRKVLLDALQQMATRSYAGADEVCSAIVDLAEPEARTT
jgi:DNA-binding MarR family transcriptional regulator